MNTIDVECPNCKKNCRTYPTSAGKVIRCPDCGRHFRVPDNKKPARWSDSKEEKILSPLEEELLHLNEKAAAEERRKSKKAWAYDDEPAEDEGEELLKPRPSRRKRREQLFMASAMFICGAVFLIIAAVIVKVSINAFFGKNATPKTTNAENQIDSYLKKAKPVLTSSRISASHDSPEAGSSGSQDAKAAGESDESKSEAASDDPFKAVMTDDAYDELRKTVREKGVDANAADPSVEQTQDDLKEERQRLNKSVQKYAVTREDVQLASVDAEKEMRNLLLNLVTDTGDAMERQIRWFAKGKRPVVGLRWAIAANLPSSSKQKITSLADLSALTHGLSDDVVNGLRKRGEFGSFGSWPSRAEEALTKVVFVTGQDPKQLRSAAAKKFCNLLVIFQPPETANREKSEWNLLIVDVPDSKSLWQSKTPLQSEGANPKETLKPFFDEISQDFFLEEMPKQKPSQVSSRWKKFEAESTKRSAAEKLQFFMELAYDDREKLIDSELMTAVCAKLFGKEAAVAIVKSDLTGRGALLRDLLNKEAASESNEENLQ